MEKMSNLMEYYLTYIDKRIKWDRVEKVYGKSKTDEIKQARTILAGCRGMK